MGKLRALRWMLSLVVAIAYGGAVSLPGHAASVTLPDLRMMVPTNLISIGVDPTTSHSMLRFTHVTWDAGTGPFEIDPNYNSGTGTATFVQAIYNSPSPGVWSLDHTVPIATLGTFVAPSDYQFPLTKFTLNSINSDGSIGSVVATSPKSDYCITGDFEVGTVPNTPSSTSPPQDDCTNPSKPLGWSVGWGDQYDQTDAGQPIDLSGVPDGTYMLRGIADPLHVLTESDSTNNVTDTVVTISGATVTVGAQTHPTVIPPSVSMTSPTAGAAVSGTVTLAANAAAISPATVASVQFLLDGLPLGSAVTTAPFTYAWTVGSTPSGSHNLSARVTDSAGNVNTAGIVPISVTPSTSGLATDATITAQGNGTVTTSAFSTSLPGETLIAELALDGPSTGAQSAVVSGAGLVWTLVRRSNTQHGDAEIWTAHAASALSGVTVTSKPSEGGFDQQVIVQSFANAAGVGGSGSASGRKGAPSVGFAASSAGSMTLAVGNDWNSATPRTLASGQQMIYQWADTAMGDTYWAQSTISLTTAAGQTVTLADTAPTADSWNMVGAEIEPGSPATPPPDTTPPSVQIINPTAGQTVSGTTSVAASASDNVAVASVQFYLDGQPLGSTVAASPYAVTWDTTKAANGTHTLTATATDTSGNVGTSAPVGVTVQNPAPAMTCFVQQAVVDVRGKGTVTTPVFNTAAPGEVLLAFVSLDGPKTVSVQWSTVSGAGLSWRLVGRANAQYGDAEVWTATTVGQLSNATVKSVPAKGGYAQDLTVVAYEGAKGVGAVVSGGSAGSAPSLTVTTTAAASLVFAVGHDWDNADARTLPTGLVMLDQWVDSGSGDTSWSEYTNQTTGLAGVQVTIGAIAPTSDQWNMVAVELLGDGG